MNTLTVATVRENKVRTYAGGVLRIRYFASVDGERFVEVYSRPNPYDETHMSCVRALLEKSKDVSTWQNLHHRGAEFDSFALAA